MKKTKRKVSPKEQQKIIELYKQNLSLCKIGRMLNRNHDTISFQLRKAGVRTDSGYKRRQVAYSKKRAEKGVKVIRHKFKMRNVKSYEELLWEKRKEDSSYLSMLKKNYKAFYQSKINE